eukprot:6637285-Pyramimonas_sp.AAC.1
MGRRLIQLRGQVLYTDVINLGRFTQCRHVLISLPVYTTGWQLSYNTCLPHINFSSSASRSNIACTIQHP